jgi:murein DD-endopeptidase MepM/ murein hydrolase activator NlpD
MLPIKTQAARATAVAVVGYVVLVAATLSTVGSPGARAATPGRLQQQIAAGQGRVSSLAGAVGGASQRVARLSASVYALQRQVHSLQSDLNSKRTQLLATESQLAGVSVRLAQLEVTEKQAEAVLSDQLVGSYEADPPDLVSVVLESTGFSDLLERLSFAARIGQQDTHIVGAVKASRRAVAAAATRLGGLEVRQQRLAVDVLSERNSVDRRRLTLVSDEISAARVRNAKAGQLSSARQSVSVLRGELVSLRAAQAAQDARAARAARRAAAPSPAPSRPSSSSGGASHTPAPSSGSSSGGFTFPLPISAAAPPSAWSLDDGVDISAPGGTPEYAVCPGTIVLHGIGGFGPSAPVIHCDHSLSGYDYVYYGHAGPGNWTPVGAHVGQGQVISEVGYGDVGISSGPHVEIGFADSSGSPIGPSSAPAMAALLHAAYGG